MADISKCEGHGCPIRTECYRHTAQSSEHWQAYLIHIPYDHGTKECEMFWDNSEYMKHKTEE